MTDIEITARETADALNKYQTDFIYYILVILIPVVSVKLYMKLRPLIL